VALARGIGDIFLSEEAKANMLKAKQDCKSKIQDQLYQRTGGPEETTIIL
jgi:hypothetical protein